MVTGPSTGVQVVASWIFWLGDLDAPMRANRAQVLLRRSGEASDEVTELDALDTVHHAATHEHTDRRQALPQAGVTQPLGSDDHVAFPHFLPAAGCP
jgi:hypothetical protein